MTTSDATLTTALAEAPERSFVPLPIDGTRGFPQSFAVLFLGVTYHFRIYANLPAETLAGGTAFFDLPAAGGHLVVRVEREESNGSRRQIFLRKTVPGLVYEVEDIVLEFPEQRLARANVNGQGDAGSRVVGRMAARWA